MSDLYIGIMSGTSANAVDAALVDFSKVKPQVLATHTEAIDSQLKQAIHAFAKPGDNELNRLAEVDIAIAKLSATAANRLLDIAEKSPNDIKAIGSHGQTIRHQPTGDLRYTLQVGDANIITAMTGISTVTDFRRHDMALGGQGAPLTPIFHQHIFADENTPRVILNLGGIANISILPHTNNTTLLGFDTGPANTLIDHWAQHHQQGTYDNKGEWASSGNIYLVLLEALLSDPYFEKQPPKSTGLEYFNQAWLNKYLEKYPQISAVDVQATLTELTAVCTSDAIKAHCPEGEIIVCGGGAYNEYLMQRLKANSPSHVVNNSEVYGIKPEWIEAVAFAWLAKLAIQHQPGNVPSVTGASSRAVLGAIYQA